MQQQTSRRAVNEDLHLKISSKRDLKIHLPASPCSPQSGSPAGSHAQPCEAGKKIAPDGIARRSGFLVWSLNRKVGENSVLAELKQHILFQFVVQYFLKSLSEKSCRNTFWQAKQRHLLSFQIILQL